MNLIRSIAPTLRQGATISLVLKAVGEDKVQLDILPSGKENKAGIVLPAKSLTGTAEELDTNLEDFMARYGATLHTVASIAATTDEELQRAEKEAQEAAKKALEAKRATKKPATSTSTASSKPARNLDAGLAGDDDNDEEEGDDKPATTLNTSTPAAASASPAVTDADSQPALTGDLFV